VKYIKTYKVFEVAKKGDPNLRIIEDDMNDIFLDLNDIGYRIKVYHQFSQYIPGHGEQSNCFELHITRNFTQDGTLYLKEFNTNEIRETVERLGDYMNLKGYSRYWVWVNNDKSIPVIPRRSDKFYNLVHYDNESTWNEKSGKWIKHGLLKRLALKLRDRIVNEKILPKNILTEEVKLVFSKSV